MSKTVRRHKAQHEYEYYYVLRDYVKNSDGYWVDIRLDKHSKEGRKRIRKFHSDNQKTMIMVPASFRRDRNRKKRRANHQCLQNFIREGCLADGPVMTPDKSDIRWLWW